MSIHSHNSFKKRSDSSHAFARYTRLEAWDFSLKLLKRKKKGRERKKMKRIITFTLVLSMILCGCANVGNNNRNSSEQPSIIDSSSDKINNPSNESPSQSTNIPSTPFVHDVSNFDWSVKLADAIYAKNQDNILFSPLSLNMALGMAESFAEGDTKVELDEYLNTNDYKDFAQKYLMYIKKAYNYETSYGFEESYKSMFEIANSMWLNSEYTPSSYAKDILNNYFNGNIESINFGNPNEACGIINNWVAKKTYDMIKEIVTPNNIDIDTTAILTNSLYFESAWAKSWSLIDEYFTNLDGSQGIPLMTSKATTYYENEQAIAFGKHYANGLMFIGILPNEEGDFELSSLNIESLLKSYGMEYSEVIAYMPSELNYDCNINIIKDFFIDNGLSSPFEKMEFQNIVKEDKNLYISDILQKCKIELDKDGTRAAAVTAIVMESNAMVEKDPPKVVKLDRPFAYLIYDEGHDQILFIGKVITTK